MCLIQREAYCQNQKTQKAFLKNLSFSGKNPSEFFFSPFFLGTFTSPPPFSFFQPLYISTRLEFFPLQPTSRGGGESLEPSLIFLDYPKMATFCFGEKGADVISYI